MPALMEPNWRKDLNIDVIETNVGRQFYVVDSFYKNYGVHPIAQILDAL